jgi:hypothetical protein
MWLLVHLEFVTIHPFLDEEAGHRQPVGNSSVVDTRRHFDTSVQVVGFDEIAARYRPVRRALVAELVRSLVPPDEVMGFIEARMTNEAVMSNYTDDDARGDQPDSVVSHKSYRPDILRSNALATSTSSPVVDDVRWVGQPSSVGCD